MPTGTNFHIDQYLTNFSVGYGYPQFIANQVAPTLRVSKQSDKYRVWGAEGHNIPQSDAVSPGATAEEIDYTLSNDTFYCNGHALRHAIADRTRAAHDDPTILDRNAVFLTKRGVELKREKLLADYVQTTTNYAAANTVTLAGVNQWNAASPDPFADIEAAKNQVSLSTGFEANTIILGRDVWNVAKQMSAFIDRIKYSMKGYLSPALFGEAVDIPNVLIGNVAYNTANEGQTASVSRLWSDNIIVAYIDQSLLGSPSIEEASPTAFTFFTWADPSLPVAEDGAVVYRYREEPRHSDVIEYEKYYDLKAPWAGAAYLINDVLA